MMIVKHFITFSEKQLFLVCLCRVLPYCLFLFMAECMESVL
jgi:hypothetical protein